jgi:hypothetical protein
VYADLPLPSFQHPRRYTVHVQAINACGWGPACPHVRFLTRSIESPESPWTTPEVMGGDTFILVQWHAVQVMHPLLLHSCRCTLVVALLSLHSCHCTLANAILPMHSYQCTLINAILQLQSCGVFFDPVAECLFVVDFDIVFWTCFFIDLFWKLVFFLLLRCCIRTFVQ